MAVDRDGEHVGAVVEDLLLAVAVMVVDVEDRHPAVSRKKIGRDRAGAEIKEAAVGARRRLALPRKNSARDRAVVEITKAAEGARLGVVARRPYQGVGEIGAFEHLL